MGLPFYTIGGIAVIANDRCRTLIKFDVHVKGY
jgi:hypothetical protein